MPLPRTMKCPNCAQKTSGTDCEWCGYPLVKARPIRKKEAPHTLKDVKDKAREEARQRASSDAELAKKVKEVVARAEKKAAEAAREKAKREAEEARHKANREAKEANRAKEAAARAEREAAEVAKEKAKREAEETKAKPGVVAEQAAQLLSGIMKLSIGRSVDYERVRKLQGLLSQVQNLRVLSVGGSSEEGTKIVISVEKPIPLLALLSEMPFVEQVGKEGNEIKVKLKASQ